MKRISTKQQSDNVIKASGLNRVNDQIFMRGQIDELKEYLKDNVYVYYNMRDKSKAGGQFLYKLSAEEVLAHADEYDKFSVYESLEDADKHHMILQGDIEISSATWDIVCSLSRQRGISNRIAMKSPEYTLCFNLLERKDPKIHGLKYMIDYIFINELFDVVVEFTLFDIPVGINKENCLIWELRNY